MMIRRATVLLLTTILALLAAPTIVWACSIVAPEPLTGIATSDVRVPRSVDGARGSWKLATKWQSQHVSAFQLVRDTNGRAKHAFHAGQDTLRLQTVVRGGGERFEQDPDSTTTCALAGHGRWSDPIVRIRETSRAVFIVAASHRYAGTTEGCISSVLSCTDTMLTRTLKQPIGDRRVYVQRFS